VDRGSDEAVTRALSKILGCFWLPLRVDHFFSRPPGALGGGGAL